ncbi:olfactory receptor [Pelobates cultripes]|uniref:Olfactory receptor n=1 Tax=Pelobates cultripes TaxID=61616 RepID=A0AAD1WLT8_PELCU|nr:olfactory receptor [Pelobates cultripes]
MLGPTLPATSGAQLNSDSTVDIESHRNITYVACQMSLIIFSVMLNLFFKSPAVRLRIAGIVSVAIGGRVCGSLVSTILKISSSEGKRKAFSTCSSHLTVVILTFGLVLGIYLSPESAFAMLQDKVFSLLYTLCIPIFNPLIYSLRNKDIKGVSTRQLQSFRNHDHRKQRVSFSRVLLCCLFVVNCSSRIWIIKYNIDYFDLYLHVVKGPPLFYVRRFMLFLIFLLTYLMALTGNLTIILVIFSGPHLHTPMYFFLCNLSFLDLTFTSTIVPKLLHICLTGHQNITYTGCILQMSIFVVCVVAEYCLLAVMAFDRYVAICHPLRYTQLMNLRICIKLAFASWFCGFLDATTYVFLLSQYSFCRSNVINHLFCDLKPLLKLSCSGTQSLESAIQLSGVLFGFTPLLFIIMTYIFILSTILRIRSKEGKRKAFSTCSSHLTVVVLFFGIILGMYMRPKSAYSIEQDKVFSVLYTICIPTMNPVIYSLRNKDLKMLIGSRVRGGGGAPTHRSGGIAKKLKFMLFLIFLLTYLMALTGNLTIILVIFSGPHLHTPMYFFLCNLSFLDLTFTSTIVPKLLHICLTGHQNITYTGCILQMSIFVVCVVAEYCLLAVMAFDRYVAICHPLRYTQLMNLRICIKLAFASWFCGFLDATTYVFLLSQYSFCRSNVINHLFCDLKPLLKLSCSGTQSLESAIQLSGVLFGFTPLLFILMTYIVILSTILRIRSKEGKQKAFSTCSSHLTVVVLFFGIILGMAMRPKSAYSIEQDKVFSVLYTICIPTMNPVIYSLRNKDHELKRVLTKGVRMMMTPTPERVRGPRGGWGPGLGFLGVIIERISDDPELQLPMFLLVLFLYLMTLGGNMTILLLICLDRHLHTPMYFFLVNLSLIDMSSATVSLHNILILFLTGDRMVPYINCLSQMFFFGAFISGELQLLIVMSYDRYVAICNPLRYTVIMNNRVCLLLAILCWITSLLENMPFIILLSGFSCYRSNIINHFFCDLLPVMKLSCSDTSVLKTLFFIEGLLFFNLIPFLLTLIPYVFIIVAILKISSNTGKRKAFYTCSSHLTVVILLYMTLIYQYMRPVTEDSLDYNKLFSLFNTAAIPILNPFIYSLNNKDISHVPIHNGRKCLGPDNIPITRHTSMGLSGLDRHLHTPMYFFLGNLSLIDMSSTTVTLHKMLFFLDSFLVEHYNFPTMNTFAARCLLVMPAMITAILSCNKTISYVTCLTQSFFIGSFTSDELMLLSIMSFDRYVAIHNPLRYTLIMNQRLCIFLAIFCWLVGLLEVMPLITLLSGFSCYRSNIINHFFCDLMPVMKLLCSDTSVLETLFFIEGVFLFTVIPFLLTFTPYIFIIVTILKIPSSTGRRKAFYTCSSHLIVSSDFAYDSIDHRTISVRLACSACSAQTIFPEIIGLYVERGATAHQAFVILSCLPIFLLVLFIYLITLGGNMTIFLIVCLDRHLHTPMYFFLGNLSLLDMFSTTITLHNILITYVTGNKTISYVTCLTQSFFIGSFTSDELMLLSIMMMSFDRYVAICNPLRYTMIMNSKVCLLSNESVIWRMDLSGVFIYCEPHTLCSGGFQIMKNGFLMTLGCRSNVINHFFCDIVPIMKLSCIRLASHDCLKSMMSVCLKYSKGLTTVAAAGAAEGFLLITFTPFLLTFISYVFIIVSILKIRSSIGRRKAFYTCSSHLTVVILLYVTLFSQYLKPTATDTSESSKFFSLFNTAIVPLLNPLIYSLKNKDVKDILTIKTSLKRIADCLWPPRTMDKYKVLIFVLVLFLYVVTLAGNMTILLLVCFDRHLHTPMYFFLCNLSILDMFSTTLTLHSVLVFFITKNNRVSYNTCITQMYFYGSFICDELLFLTAMSYDRYVAICNPLCYHMYMNNQVCALLALTCWLIGFLEIIPYVLLLLHLSCYKSNIVNHFFCDLVPLMKLSCKCEEQHPGDTVLSERHCNLPCLPGISLLRHSSQQPNKEKLQSKTFERNLRKEKYQNITYERGNHRHYREEYDRNDFEYPTTSKTSSSVHHHWNRSYKDVVKEGRRKTHDESPQKGRKTQGDMRKISLNRVEKERQK